ncbi:MAG TPA: hypothetical protein VMT52_08720, partial [Planctomycetota bacterium]|nr:hypothetical protein [Planctomycetota bacterium]
LLEPNGNSALVHVDGGQRKVSVVYLGSALELLDLVLILKDSGDPIETIEGDSGNPIEITYSSSDCIGAVICDTSCRVVSRSREKTFAVSETPVKAPKKCERVEQEDKTCTEKLKTICLQQLYPNKECTNPRHEPSEVNGWRCN